MKELLESYNWYMFHQCTCGGTLKQKFKNPNKPSLMFKIMPRKNVWELYINNKFVTKGNQADLKNKLDEV